MDIPVGALCGTHTSEPAIAVCARCGLFMCTQCGAIDLKLCPACNARGVAPEPVPFTGPDGLGWALIATPVVAGLLMMALPVTEASTYLSYAAIFATMVLIGIDAKKGGQAAAGFVVGAALLWLVVYPLYMHRRASWGRPKLLLFSFGSMLIFFTGFFVHPFAPQERAIVRCKPAGKTLGEGYTCSIERTEGNKTLSASFDIVADCGTVTGTAHAAAMAPPHKQTDVRVPFTAFDHLEGCKTLQKTEVKGLVLTIVP